MLCQKGGDTVGELQSAENCASQMPSLKAQEHVESNVATVALSRGNRFANSIGGFLAKVREHQVMVQPVARRLLVSLLIKKDF